MRAFASPIRVPRRSRRLVLLLVCCTVTAALPSLASSPPSPAGPGQPASGQQGRELRQLTAAVHVHTEASTGAYSLSTLSNVARNEGIDVVVLSENLQLDFRYGPWPLRYFYELHRTLPSLGQHGIGNFLAELEEVQSDQALPLLLPGVEVMPHYYWTGTLVGRNKTLHDMQRNMLVVVPPPGEGAAVEDAVNQGREYLRGLPAIGNPGGERHGWKSLPMLLPGLLLLGCGIRRLSRRQSRLPVSWRGAWRVLIGGDHPQVPMKEVAFRALLLFGGIYLLVHNYPYSIPLHSHYDRGAGLAPYQQLIDYTKQQGGLVYWSMPEAFDYHDLSAGPVAVRLSTDPYPSVISETSGHTGFGGVYAQDVTLLDAGGAWDASLTSYSRGERSTPPWVIGEGAFHYTGQARKRLSDVLTVLWAQEPTRAAVFDALARGRSYALRQDWPESLRLREFTLGIPSTGQRAWPGDTLEIDPKTEGVDQGELEFDLVVEMFSESNAAMPVHVEIIRQGETYLAWEEMTPFRRSITEVIGPGEEPIYYRVIAKGPQPLLVVSNPIFVRRQ